MATRARTQSARTKRTIDPKKITSVSTWIEYYKKKYGNLLVVDGKFLVLDPKVYAEDYETAVLEPAKVLVPDKAIDIEQVLGNPSAYPQLRATAEERQTFLNEQHDAAVQDAKDRVNHAEADLLNAAAAWDDMSVEMVSGGARRELAMEVAQRTKDLEEAEAALSRAMYPVKYIVAETGLLRNALNYASRDTRKFDEDVYRIVEDTSRMSDRVIPYVGGEVTPVASLPAPTLIPEMLTASAVPEVPTMNVNPVLPVGLPVASTLAPAAPEGAVSAANAGTATFTTTALPVKRRASRKAKPVPAPEVPTANIASLGVPLAPVVENAPQSGGAVPAVAPVAVAPVAVAPVAVAPAVAPVAPVAPAVTPVAPAAPVAPVLPVVAPQPAEEPKMLKILL